MIILYFLQMIFGEVVGERIYPAEQDALGSPNRSQLGDILNDSVSWGFLLIKLS